MVWVVFALVVVCVIWIASINRDEEWLNEQRERQARLGSDSDDSPKPLILGVQHVHRKTGHRKPGDPTHQITYTDAEGNTTQRNIALYKSGHTNIRFEAWCELRQARRNFLFIRVQSAIDLSTGEILTKAEFFSLVHPSRKVPKELLEQGSSSSQAFP